MNKKVILGIIIGLCLAVYLPLSAFGAPPKPMDDIRGPIEMGLAILKDPAYAPEGKREAQREKIWETIKEAFNFRVISMRALARHWRTLSSEQQNQFVEVFTELLKNTYLDKVQGQFHNEEVIFVDQMMLTDKKAVVKTNVIRGEQEIPLDYSVFLKDNRWKVYDIKVEGVSLVKNYRTQFDKILAKKSPAALIDQLKKKNESHEEDRTAEK